MADSLEISKSHLKEKYLKRAHNLAKKKKRNKVRATFTHSLDESYHPMTPNERPTQHSLPNDYHSNVNKELKRLLLASVGSDLQEQLESLVHDKSSLKYRLDIALNHLIECTEEMDELSVEADVWKSKVLASRVMIDELKTWKGHANLDCYNSHRAIETLLKEREQLIHFISSCHSMLVTIGTSLGHYPSSITDSSTYGRKLQVATVNPVQLLPNSQGCTVLELVQNMSLTIKIISDKINELTKASPIATPTPAHLSLTEGEKMGRKILYPGPVTTLTPPIVPHLSFGEQNLISQRRGKPHPLINNDYYYNDRHYCRKCNGSKILII